MKIFKPNQKQNLVVLTEPSDEKYIISLKVGNMVLNRFCMYEDAAFELSGVNYFKKTSEDIVYDGDLEFELKRKEKGMEYLFLRSTFNFNLIYVNS